MKHEVGSRAADIDYKGGPTLAGEEIGQSKL